MKNLQKKKKMSKRILKLKENSTHSKSTLDTISLTPDYEALPQRETEVLVNTGHVQ